MGNQSYLTTLLCSTCLFLTACGTIAPLVIQMPTDFDYAPEAIEVDLPRGSATNKGFDVPVGEYAVRYTSVDPFVKDEKKKLVSSEKEDKSWLDVLIAKELPIFAKEKKVYGVAGSRNYRFNLADNETDVQETKCHMIRSVAIEEYPTKSFAGIATADSGTEWETFENGSWMQTTYKCEFNSNTELSNADSANLSVLSIRDKKPIYVFKSASRQYKFAPLYNLSSHSLLSSNETPTISDENSEVQDALSILNGVGIFENDEQIALISFLGQKKSIWLKNGLEKNESELLLNISHAIILSNLLDDS